MQTPKLSTTSCYILFKTRFVMLDDQTFAILWLKVQLHLPKKFILFALVKIFKNDEKCFFRSSNFCHDFLSSRKTA